MSTQNTNAPSSIFFKPQPPFGFPPLSREQLEELALIFESLSDSSDLTVKKLPCGIWMAVRDNRKSTQAA